MFVSKKKVVSLLFKTNALLLLETTGETKAVVEHFECDGTSFRMCPLFTTLLKPENGEKKEERNEELICSVNCSKLVAEIMRLHNGARPTAVSRQLLLGH